MGCARVLFVWEKAGVSRRDGDGRDGRLDILRSKPSRTADPKGRSAGSMCPAGPKRAQRRSANAMAAWSEVRGRELPAPPMLRKIFLPCLAWHWAMSDSSVG